MVDITLKEMLVKELIKNGYSEENSSKIWNISNRSFRYINENMAKSFLKIREHPRYKATIIDTETKLLKENIGRFLNCMENCKFNLIDMNCIDGTKAKAIIESLPIDIKLRYCPININSYLVQLSFEKIKKENFQNVVDYAARISKDFESLDQIGAALRNATYQKNVLLLLGSILSNFEINNYLFRLSQTMFPDDILIIGNGIRTGQRLVNLEVYKNPLFNAWLIHLMRELGFEDNEIEYDARFNNNRLEIYYTIKTNKKIKSEGNIIELKKNDKIIVIFQYKLYENELKDFCKMYFEKVELVKDPAEEYALVMCKK